MISNRKAIMSSIITSSVIFLFLIWFIYFRADSISRVDFSFLKPVNASLNFCAALSLVFGFNAIRKGNETRHKTWMLTALGFSALFLISYLTYHHFHGDTIFLKQGLIRGIYFFILVSHIILTMVVLPLILLTVFYAFTSQFTLHKKVAKWTFFLWMYVSVTGVLVYLLQL